MATYNIYVVSKTMAGKDTTQDANRSHDADNYTWIVTNGKNHHFYYNTSAPAGKANFHVESTLSTVVDDVFKITTGLGDAVEIKGNRSAYFRGDALFTADCYVTTLKSTFFPATNITLASNIVASSVGIRPGYLTTAQRLALNLVTYEGITVYDSDKKCDYKSNGTIWINQTKSEPVTTAERLALNVAHYEGITVYDTDTSTLWLSDGTNWNEQ
ncbi:MAG: hypothetical protein ACKO96_25785 [Flammeovirgaceae bacterium]